MPMTGQSRLRRSEQGERSRVASPLGLRIGLLVPTPVDAGSGSDSKYEDGKSVVAYVVDATVPADADAPRVRLAVPCGAASNSKPLAGYWSKVLDQPA